MKAQWIWYPGDFEVWLGNIFNNRRTERGAFFPPFWKQDSHWPTVVFTRDVNLTEPESITIAAEGQMNLAIDGKLIGPIRPIGPIGPISLISPISLTSPMRPMSTFTIPAGHHTLALKVWNQATPPALFIDGPTIKTDSSWQVTYEDKIWIDENGQAHGSGIYVPAGVAHLVGHASKRADNCTAATLGSVAHYGFDSIDTPPSQFRLPTKPLRPVCCDAIATNGTNGTLYDFGRETFGYLRIHGLKGTVRIYYGESREEALDKEYCETLDILSEGCQLGSKAFRFVYIEKENEASYDDVTMDYEYTPFSPEKSGSFRCSDDDLNRIWEVSAYTLDLTTREFFCDGIKRDRWTWSGDAIQSYLMNYYLRFDTECVKRTIRQLRGKDPVTAHVNTIMDYTFYWFISIWQYYKYTGDIDFLEEIYPKMLTLMDYVLGRLNADGMAEGKPDDWVFVDWTDFPMHKQGTLCFEQLLLHEAFRSMVRCCFFCHDTANTHRFIRLSLALSKQIKKMFWNEEYGALIHSIEDGQKNEQITKFPNMFAIIFEFFNQERHKAILDHVLLNPNVPPITTPYMRFYELDALCTMGLHGHVLQEMKAYWGGMLRQGATTFWEKYNPEEKGTEHLAMYGRPYGKSLCHSWGASPIYIIGKHFLGVRPTKSGYREYEVRPALGGLDWIKGDVPTPFGLVHVEMDKESVSVLSDVNHGFLIIGDKKITIPPKKKITVKL